DALQVADPVAVRVGEGPGIDLVEDGRLPPGVALSHGGTLRGVAKSAIWRIERARSGPHDGAPALGGRVTGEKGRAAAHPSAHCSFGAAFGGVREQMLALLIGRCAAVLAPGAVFRAPRPAP